MPEPIIRLEHVEKAYNSQGKLLKVFEDLNLEVYRGELLAIFGPTGCGKTTLLNLIAGFDKPQAGKIYVKNVEIGSLPESRLADFRRKHVGVVFQTDNLVPDMTVFENVELPLVFAGVGRAERHRRVEEALKAFWISSYADRKVSTLSVGERRMVSLARAVVTDPEILLLDEPTDFLDALTVDLMISSLKGRLMRGKTLVATTHRGRLVRVAERVVRLKKRLP
ncbi:MAG: ABC transporter ATP-binding protein [Candidatus Hecatellales archaeon]|nr:MAG: ABC transporter ATP-binding protein [Candidatus Hecatellales archaeon]RLI34105.1 MAG: ABC transporter ATP-binding protein [Candidatus Bathyarchaeota archaeon]